MLNINKIYKSWLFFRESIPYNSTVSNLINKYKILKYSYLESKRISLKHILLAILATGNIIFKIDKSRVVNNIFPEKINHDL